MCWCLCHNLTSTRIVGFLQSVNRSKDENPTRKPTANISKHPCGKNEKARQGALQEKFWLDFFTGNIEWKSK